MGGFVVQDAPWLIIIQQVGHGCHYFWSHDGIHPGCVYRSITMEP